jgi:GT2 family glycosyltransferase
LIQEKLNFKIIDICLDNTLNNNPTVFVVIAVFNRIENTRQCLKYLHGQTFSPIQVIIIDDGSTDGTSEMIKNEFPKVHIIYGDGKYWWAKSMNLGIDAALKMSDNNDLILTLNDDTIIDDRYIDIIVKESIKFPSTLIGSLNLIEGDPLKIFSAGGKYDLLFSNHIPNINQNEIYDKELINDYYETDFLPGRGTLIPIEVYKQIGVYDSEKFPQYIADEEFSFRAKNAGFECIVSSKALIYVKKNTSGFENIGSKLGIKDFIKSLNAINSTNNIKNRINFAKKYAKYSSLFIVINIGKMLLYNFVSIIEHKIQIKFSKKI